MVSATTHAGVGATVSARSTTAGATCGTGAWGRRTTKRLPWPGSLSAAIVPPCVSAMRRATARPSPTPARPSRRADSAR